MKLYLKQKVFTIRDKFTVKNEAGEDKYAVHGEILTIGKKLHIDDMNGNEIAFIRQKVLSFLPKFFVEINGQVVCEIVKEFTFFTPKYKLKGTSWRLEGDLLAHEYSLFDGEQLIMTMSKKWITWGDTYEIDVALPEHELAALCIALAVDCALAMQKN